MPPDTGPDYVDQRIAELLRQLHAIAAELAELEAISRGNRVPERRRRFTIIQGGAAALVAVVAGIGELAGRRPRHPVAIGAALTAAGAAALVLAVPTYGSPPRRGMAIPPVFAVPGPPAPTPAVGSHPGAHPSTPTTSDIAPQVRPWTASAIPTESVGTTTAPASGPSGAGSASPSESAPASPSGTPSTPAPGPSTPYCLVTVIVPGVLNVCVL